MEKKILIVKSIFNPKITQGLLEGAYYAFNQNPVENCMIEEVSVPGAFEIPFVIKKKFSQSPQNYIGALALACIIKGETAHFEYISASTINALQQLNLTFDAPTALGIITTYNLNQAKKRALSTRKQNILSIFFRSAEVKKFKSNKGKEAMQALLDVINTN